MIPGMDAITRMRALPWKAALLNLRDRMTSDQLALTASSLTFTTTIALVPFFTVALAVFTAFPMFATLETVLQQWLVQSLVPDNIARQVLGYLTQFSGKASRLGTVGLAVLFVTALALVLTIDRTLNRIWRVRRQRPLRQRVLIYWAVITLGPLLLAVSLTITSYLVTVSKGVVTGQPAGLRWLLNLLEFVLLASGGAALFRCVPNTHVPWSNAWAGGVLVAAGFELAKKLLTLYLAAMPTYSVVYGAFATVPILLVWIYLAWLIVLVSAVLVASLPGLLQGEVRVPSAQGWNFQLALEVLQQLEAARSQGGAGMTLAELAQGLAVEPSQLDLALYGLTQLDWIAQLDELQVARSPRYVLLANLQAVRLDTLAGILLLTRSPETEVYYKNGLLPSSNVHSVLQTI